MKLTIIMPFRPARRDKNRVLCPMYQDDNGFWHINNINGDIHEIIQGEDVLERGIKALRKNSVYYHKIIIAHEPDIYFSKIYKENLNIKYNVEFFISSKYTYSLGAKEGSLNISNTVREVILSLSDNEIVCESYIADIVCNKYWDKYIKEAYDIYGEDKVYIPLFIEPRNRINNTHLMFCGPNAQLYNLEDETTVNNIWETWRFRVCHALSMKVPIDRDYMIEKDLDDWSAICNQYRKKIIIERCGDRCYGYYSGMIAKNKLFKKAADGLLCTTASSDLQFDNDLNTDKVVVTQAHTFHLHNRCELDNIEVEHE